MVGVGNESKLIARAAIAAGLMLALTPAALLARGDGKRPAPVSISFDRFSTFTPAGADPRLVAALANKAPSATDFHFTPAAPKGRPAQLRVAIRARAVTPAVLAARTGSADRATGAIALAPATYNLGVAVGWRRFAISGDVGKVTGNGSPLGSRESAALGVSYNLKRFTGRLALGAERGEGNQAPALAKNDNVSVDLGGAYSLTRNLAVTGGVRYKVEREQLRSLADQRRDSQAVYVGTAFKF
jgi:hypothetical protein